MKKNILRFIMLIPFFLMSFYYTLPEFLNTQAKPFISGANNQFLTQFSYIRYDNNGHAYYLLDVKSLNGEGGGAVKSAPVQGVKNTKIENQWSMYSNAKSFLERFHSMGKDFASNLAPFVWADMKKQITSGIIKGQNGRLFTDLEADTFILKVKSLIKVNRDIFLQLSKLPESELKVMAKKYKIAMNCYTAYCRSEFWEDGMEDVHAAIVKKMRAHVGEVSTFLLEKEIKCNDTDRITTFQDFNGGMEFSLLVRRDGQNNYSEQAAYYAELLNILIDA